MNEPVKRSLIVPVVLIVLMIAAFVVAVILLAKCPPIPIPADQPAPSPAPPIGAPEVQPVKVDVENKPDLGVKGVSL